MRSKQSRTTVTETAKMRKRLMTDIKRRFEKMSLVYEHNPKFAYLQQPAPIPGLGV